jgi:predicted regulator of Ras-like GTPase activity (Roadblock/LC7/MglB family)
MQTVLSQLNSLPGVVGSLVCGMDGHILAQAFPAVFEQRIVQEAARSLTDAAQAVDFARAADDLIDLRFREVRLLARPCSGGLLAVLCSGTTNFQLLVLATAAAVAKLEREHRAARAAPAALTSPAASAVHPPPAREASPRPGAHVAAPAKGLEELHRRLAGSRDTTGEHSLGSGLPLRRH